ncbi:MAG: tyrosine-type recombinase/integrase [Sulfuricaulis sp.]
MFFTGLRRQEAARLRWDDVDLIERTLIILDTKNHEPLTLPLSSFVFALLSNRSSRKINEYVFPGSGIQGYIVEPRAAIQCVIEASGVDFTLHDLRRTFITVADSLDIPGYAIKRLVNHKIGRDVTAGYIVHDIERLRRPMQQINDYLLQQATKQASTNVVKLRVQPATA